MAVPVIQFSFAYGEVTPALYGRQDLARFHAAASTMRNMVVSYRGGSFSRAGTKFVGYSKQTGRAYPPRLIPFQFNVRQGLVLEFGHQYVRVISDGGFVVTNSVAITNASQASLAVITISTSGIASSTANNAGVTLSYTPGELITVAGGTGTQAGVLEVASTEVLSAASLKVASASYAPTQTITLTGGFTVTNPIVTIVTTCVASATIAAAGAGGANGTQTVTGTTGIGTAFQASVTVAGGIITAVLAITVRGSYTTNPTVLANEPVTGAGLAGAQLSVIMAPNTVTVTNPGVLTTNPNGYILTQSATSGTGTGAQFYAVFGIDALTVDTAGVYSTLPTNPASQLSTTDSGSGAVFTLTGSSGVPAWATGDWINISGVLGMTELNGGTYVITKLTDTTYALYDVFGVAINSNDFAAYISGGSAAETYTLASPYNEQDLPYLKATQSADVMSLCLVNQETQVEYLPYDLRRSGSNVAWAFEPLTTAASISAPAGGIGIAFTEGGDAYYAYVVTAVAADGTESVASVRGEATLAFDFNEKSGAIIVTSAQVDSAVQYNLYKALPSMSINVPAGALFGYAAKSYGPRFIDTNITPDFSQVPPLHKNPFRRGQVLYVDMLSTTEDWTIATATITTSTGTDAVLECVVTTTLTSNPAFVGPDLTITPGGVGAIIVVNPGGEYRETDTVVITGDGTAATARLRVGPLTGTYPSVPGYFQQRRTYANTMNNPDTYHMSKPGLYKNFDVRQPTIADDAITGNPWAQQVNGIQWMVQLPAGLLVMTGLSAWVLAGVGSFATNVQAISPSSQNAVPQAFTGVSPIVEPLKINYEVLYVERNGVLWYALPYQLYALSEPLDLTENSAHLFLGHTQLQSAWCEQPHKVAWSLRSDGVLLSCTYLKEQKINGWARHDTQGSFRSICSVIEASADALYVCAQRYFGINAPYMIERMNDRVWASVEDTWAVDSALALTQPTPNAEIFVSSPVGSGNITDVTIDAGGADWSAATQIRIFDEQTVDGGSGAIATPVIVNGVITGVTITDTGIDYKFPRVEAIDPTNAGSGFSGRPVLLNHASVLVSASVFGSDAVGMRIRVGGGIMVVTERLSSTEANVNILSPIVEVIPNTLPVVMMPQVAGAWTMTAPVSSLRVPHLAGRVVTGLADGNVITPRTASVTGLVTLDTPASSAVVGLTFKPQMQSVYIDAGEPTVQGQRKKIAAVTARVQASRGFTISTNQPDGSVQSPPQNSPLWGVQNAMVEPQQKVVAPYNALCMPLFTGDLRTTVPGGFDTRGQVAIEQPYPLPLTILAFISELTQGDQLELKAPAAQPARGAQ